METAPCGLGRKIRTSSQEEKFAVSLAVSFAARNIWREKTTVNQFLTRKRCHWHSKEAVSDQEKSAIRATPRVTLFQLHDKDMRQRRGQEGH